MAVNGALVESWTLSLHDKAPRTLRHYLDEVWRIAGWLVDHSRPAAAPGDLLAVERKDVEAWLMAQRTAGLSQAPMHNRWVALRNLYGWAVAEEEIERSPLDRVVVAKANTPAPDVLTDDELKLLLTVCFGRAFYARRDLALIRFMLATGLRVSETVDRGRFKGGPRRQPARHAIPIGSQASRGGEALGGRGTYWLASGRHSPGYERRPRNLSFGRPTQTPDIQVTQRSTVRMMAGPWGALPRYCSYL